MEERAMEERAVVAFAPHLPGAPHCLVPRVTRGRQVGDIEEPLVASHLLPKPCTLHPTPYTLNPAP